MSPLSTRQPDAPTWEPIADAERVSETPEHIAACRLDALLIDEAADDRTFERVDVRTSAGSVEVHHCIWPTQRGASGRHVLEISPLPQSDWRCRATYTERAVAPELFVVVECRTRSAAVVLTEVCPRYAGERTWHAVRLGSHGENQTELSVSCAGSR